MDRSGQAFEDTVNSLAGALHHAGQALSEAATAVALVMSAEREALELRKLEEATGTSTPGSQSDFQRGFEAGKSTKLSLVRALSDCITRVHQRRVRMSDTLGEIAGILEKEMGLDSGTMWPEKLSLNVASQNHPGLSLLMRIILEVKKRGEANPDDVFVTMTRAVEQMAGLAEGAIWPDGTDVVWAVAGAEVKAVVPPKKRYVVGFLFTADLQHVVLIRKKRPEWQAGKLNGIGGHIEDGETPEAAMRREFKEEAGMQVDQWKHFTTLSDAANRFSVDWFWSVESSMAESTRLMSPTDETACWVPVETVLDVKTATQQGIELMIPNLRWLIPMALNDFLGRDVCTLFNIVEEEHSGERHD